MGNRSVAPCSLACRRFVAVPLSAPPRNGKPFHYEQSPASRLLQRNDSGSALLLLLLRDARLVEELDDRGGAKVGGRSPGAEGPDHLLLGCHLQHLHGGRP